MPQILITDMINKIKSEVIVFLNTTFPIQMAKLRYKKYFRKSLDLKNPTDINAQILWESFYADTTEWTRLADKYAVREFVKERGLEEILVTLYGKWEKVEDVNWDILPNEFILKTNNGSGTNIVVKDKSSANIEELSAQLNMFLKKVEKPRASEFHYQGMKPCVIAEELLHNPEEDEKYTSSIIDYKIWCFNGKPYSFFIGTNRSNKSVEFHSYDLNWIQHKEHMVYDKKGGYHKEPTFALPKPKNFERLLEVASTLSKGFPIVRVDLYDIEGRIYFGEMTFTSNGGIMNFYTMEYAEELGRQVSMKDLLSIKKK